VVCTGVYEKGVCIPVRELGSGHRDGRRGGRDWRLMRVRKLVGRCCPPLSHALTQQTRSSSPIANIHPLCHAMRPTCAVAFLAQSVPGEQRQELISPRGRSFGLILYLTQSYLHIIHHVHSLSRSSQNSAKRQAFKRGRGSSQRRMNESFDNLKAAESEAARLRDRLLVLSQRKKDTEHLSTEVSSPLSVDFIQRSFKKYSVDAFQLPIIRCSAPKKRTITWPSVWSLAAGCLFYARTVVLTPCHCPSPHLSRIRGEI
jgi:hypothetical protein